MIQSKRIPIIVGVALVFAVIISVLLVVIGDIQAKNGAAKSEAAYTSKVFGTDIISIEIIAEEADWQQMLDNAESEPYIMADVVVNGTKFQQVGIRPKGNSSLTQVASSESERYSFRLQFDEYIKDQTCFGLDSFVVNNLVGDTTYMKEYVSYELMHEIGVDAPCFGFADIKVNGKGWGLYLAVETYGDSYEARTFKTTGGMLYNVKNMDMGGEKTKESDFPQDRAELPANGTGALFSQSASQKGPGEQTESKAQQADANMPTAMQFVPQNSNDATKRHSGNFKAPPMGTRANNGNSLAYTTDEVSAYGAIFNNVIGKGDESDFKRVVAALKALSQGENLETYFSVDQILRYLAAHTIVVNLDSYSSSMAQNYYLYENNGKLTILPWDYNLAWGGFQKVSASSVINFPIDSPVSDVEMSDRPLLEKLLSNPEYMKKYHSYLQKLMEDYFQDGKWEEKITQLDARISEYVKNDNTAFYTFEAYKTAIKTFKTLGNLRCQSIQGQLDGMVPSTKAEQTANPDKLISDGNINLSLLGTMMGGSNRGKEQNPAENPITMSPDNGEASSPFREQEACETSVSESLRISCVLFAVVLLATFLVARKKRKY